MTPPSEIKFNFRWLHYWTSVHAFPINLSRYDEVICLTTQLAWQGHKRHILSNVTDKNSKYGLPMVGSTECSDVNFCTNQKLHILCLARGNFTYP